MKKRMLLTIFLSSLMVLSHCKKASSDQENEKVEEISIPQTPPGSMDSTVPADGVKTDIPNTGNLVCSWKGKEIGSGRWVEDAAAQYRYCQCQNGKFEGCAQTLPSGVAADQVVKVEAPAPSTNLVCTWKGRTVDNGKWLEDSAAQFRYCQCQSGKFGSCAQTLPSGVAPDQVVKIEVPAPPAGAACMWKGVTLASGKWVEDAAAQFRYCQCQNGRFLGCAQMLPADVNAVDVVKIP